MKKPFQFRLRTLMIVVTLLAVPCAYIGWNARIVAERNALRKGSQFFEAIETSDQPSLKISWVRRLLGDSDCMILIADDSVTNDELNACRAAFPVAKVYRNGENGERQQFYIRNGRLTPDNKP